MTLAHELGHLVMHPGAAKLRSEFPPSANAKLLPFESAEWQANKFASLFLMPTHIIRDFTSATQLAESCKVSLLAAQIRYSELPAIKRPTPDCISEALKHFSP
jgi:Zn-dependent peptidase ImmA (M78 family)